MTTDFAIAYVKQRMCGNEYTIHFRHLVLQPAKSIKIPAGDQLFILIEPLSDIRIESSTGIFDESEDRTNELQYEHTGEIVITNLSIFTSHVRFIQVIAKNNKLLCP